MRENLFGRQYIRTAYTISNIASVMHAKGKFQETLNMDNETLPAIEKVRGSNDPRTVVLAAKSMNAANIR